MFRRNADVLAVILLCAAAVICSEARQIVIRDLVSERSVVFARHVSGPSVELMAPLCIFGIAR